MRPRKRTASAAPKGNRRRPTIGEHLFYDVR
jgi:hypothetical protein